MWGAYDLKTFQKMGYDTASVAGNNITSTFEWNYNGYGEQLLQGKNWICGSDWT